MTVGRRGGGGGGGGSRGGFSGRGGRGGFNPGFGTRMLNRNVFIGPQPQNIGPGQRLMSYGPGGGRGGRWWGGRGGWGWPYNYTWGSWGWPYYWSYPYYSGYAATPATPYEVFPGQHPSLPQAQQYCQSIYWPFCSQSSNAGTSYCRNWAAWCLAVSPE